MRFTNIASAAAIVVALGFSGAAYASTIVGGVSVTDIDLPRVQAMCDQMVGDSQTLGDTEMATDMDATAMDSAASVDSDSKVIDDITIQDCIEAGLLPADTAIPEVEGATTN